MSDFKFKVCPGILLSCFADICDAFCDIMCFRITSPTEDSQLKVLCFNFVQQCIETQPALAELLLGISLQDNEREKSILRTPTSAKSDSNRLDIVNVYDVKCLEAAWMMLK